MKQTLNQTWLDKTIGYFSPRAALERQRARVASHLLARHYEAASSGRRTQNWHRSGGDANAAVQQGLARLRDIARDLVRNNPYADSAVDTLADHVVGTGIVPKPMKNDKKVHELWRRWAESTDCDADGRNDFYGLQHLAMRTVVESGEVLIRKRTRLLEDGYALPLQIQVLEPDYLDTAKTGVRTQSGGKIVHGVEYNVLGKRVAYWLFPEHPGSNLFTSPASVRVPAEYVRHVFLHKRAGQVRGPSWFASTLLKFKDFDEFEDATLVKQKIAACLAVLTSDPDGTAPPLGAKEEADPLLDSLEPGLIMNVAPGRSVDVVQPPSSGDYLDFSKITLRAIATGLGVSYEDLTGDYTGLPFSAARMSRLRHLRRVEKWQHQMMIPQFCVPIWAWAMEVITILGHNGADGLLARWTPPPPKMLEPQAESDAIRSQIRNGILTLSEAARERGYELDELLAEMAEDQKLLDKHGIILDSDPRYRTPQGNVVTTPAEPAEPGKKPDDGSDDEAQKTDEELKKEKEAAQAAKKAKGGA